MPQLYVTDDETGLVTPERELRGFAKVWLQPGESRRISISVRRQDLTHFHTGTNT
ncbi:fibronectin type III-like domain-contianing protein [Microbacterium saperdae]